MGSSNLQLIESPNPTEIIPEEVTLESLDLFMRSCKQLLVRMELLKHDVDLISAGKKLVFAVDFSEIYTHLYPEKSNSQYRQTTELLLRSKEITFTLFPGTIIELVKALRRVMYRNQELRSQVHDIIARPFVREFFKNFSDENRFLDLGISGTTSNLRSNLAEAAELRRLVKRLSSLFDSNNFVPIEDLVAPEEMSINQDVYDRCLTYLNLYRPGGREFNNVVDAHNYALAWGLSEKRVKTRQQLFMMLTSSPRPLRVYRELKWHSLRMIVNMPSLTETSLARDPYQILYLARILEDKKSSSKNVREIKSSLTSLITQIGKLGEYEHIDRRHEKDTIERLITMPKSKRFVGTFLRFRENYNQFFDEVRKAIEGDLIAEENYRWEKGVSPYSVEPALTGETHSIDELVSSRVLFKLFDDVTKITLNIINKNRRLLKGFPSELLHQVDLEGIVVDPRRLRILRNKSELFGSEEFRVVDRDDTFLSGDIYSDFYAIWWQSDVSFNEFLSSARRYIATVPASKPHNKEKCFNGIYLFFSENSEPEVMPFDANPELSSEIIHDMVAGRRMQMVRIAGPWGDLCYDFEAFRAIPQRIGFVSHRKDVSELAWFVHGTNKQKTALFEWQRVLKAVLGIATIRRKNDPKT